MTSTPLIKATIKVMSHAVKATLRLNKRLYDSARTESYIESTQESTLEHSLSPNSMISPDIINNVVYESNPSCSEKSVHPAELANAENSGLQNVSLKIFEHNSDNQNIRRNKTQKRSPENLDITLQNLRTKKVKFSDERTARTKVAEALSKIIKDARKNNTLGNYATSTGLLSVALLKEKLDKQLMKSISVGEIRQIVKSILNDCDDASPQ